MFLKSNFNPFMCELFIAVVSNSGYVNFIENNNEWEVMRKEAIMALFKQFSWNLPRETT
jgi:hypothetical protein